MYKQILLDICHDDFDTKLNLMSHSQLTTLLQVTIITKKVNLGIIKLYLGYK